jgi:hypothetical protein
VPEYAGSADSGSWAAPAGSEDPLAGLGQYEIRNLAAHLEAAGREADLHRLLSLGRRTGADADMSHNGRIVNAWFDARERVSGAAGYTDDLARAHRLACLSAENEVASHRRAVSIGLEARYVLLSSSVRSYADRMPAALLPLLVEQQLLSVEQALAQARLAADMPQRAEGIAMLAAVAQGGNRGALLEEAAQITREIGDVEQRARTFVALLRLASGKRKDALIEEALHVIAEVPYYSQEDLLVSIAPLLPTRSRMRLVAIADAMEGINYRARGLACLAPLLPISQRAGIFERAVALGRTEGDDWVQLNVTVLAPGLPEPERSTRLWQEVDETRRMDWGSFRAHRVLLVARQLAPSARAKIVADTVAAALEDLDDDPATWMAEEAVAELIPYLPKRRREQLIDRAFAAATRWARNHNEGHLLALLAPFLPERLLPEAVRSAVRISYDDERIEVLRALGPRLDALLLRDAMTGLQMIDDGSTRVLLLLDLCRLLPPRMRGRLLKATINVAAGCRNGYSRESSLARVIPMIAELRPTSAISLLDDLQRHQERADAVIGILPFVSGPQKARLIALALKETRAIDNDEAQSRRLVAIASYIGLRNRVELLREALRRSEKLLGEARASVLAALAQGLPRSLIPEVLEHAMAIENIWRIDALEGLLPMLSGPQLHRMLRQAMAAENSDLAVPTVSSLIPYLPATEIAIVAHWTRSLPGERRLPISISLLGRTAGPERARLADSCLAALRARRSEGLRDAVSSGTALSEERYRGAYADGLLSVMPYLLREPRAALFTETIREIDAMRDGIWRARLLQQAAALAPPREKHRLLAEAVQSARSIDEHIARANVLAGIAMDLTGASKVEALREALEAAVGIPRFLNQARPLREIAGLAASLPPPEIHSLWDRTTMALARNPRSDSLLSLAALFPLARSVGGAAAVVRIAAALCDVGAWFP